MKFTKNAPQWDAVGVEPTTDLKQNGFIAGYKPPASYFNYLFNNYTSCIKEIQQGLSNVDNTSDKTKINKYLSKDYITKLELVGEGKTLPYDLPEYAVIVNSEIHILGSYVSGNIYKHYKFDGTNWSSVSTLPTTISGVTVLNNEIYISDRDGAIKKCNGTNWVSVINSYSYLPYSYHNINALETINNELHILAYSYDDLSYKHFKYTDNTMTELSQVNVYDDKGYARLINDELYIINVRLVSGGSLTCLKFDGENWIDLSYKIPSEYFDYSTKLIYFKDNLYAFGTSNNENQVSVYNGNAWKILNSFPYRVMCNPLEFENKLHFLGLGEIYDYPKNHYTFSDLVYIDNINNINNYKVNDIYGENATVDVNTSNNYILGNDNISKGNQLTLGHYNNAENITAGAKTGVDGTALCVGNGTSETRANAFRVNYDGSVFGLSNFNASGADFAEFREWLDGNENNEDRVGYFVTREGLKIRKANAGEYVAGVTSGNPCIVGNSDECWRGKYETDNFNRFIEETYEYEEEVNGATVTKTGTRYKVSPNYDPEQEYTERAKRKEWAYVCMRGEIAVYDDGTCQVNDYCKVANGGIATAAQVTEYSYLTPIYRVVERVADNIIKIEY